MKRFLLGRALLHALFFLIAGTFGFASAFLGGVKEVGENTGAVSHGPASFFAVYFILLGLEFLLVHRGQLFSAKLWRSLSECAHVVGKALWDIFAACFAFCIAFAVEFYSIRRIAADESLFLVGSVYLVLFLLADTAGSAIAWRLGQKKRPIPEERAFEP